MKKYKSNVMTIRQALHSMMTSKHIANVHDEENETLKCPYCDDRFTILPLKSNILYSNCITYILMLRVLMKERIFKLMYQTVMFFFIFQMSPTQVC